MREAPRQPRGWSDEEAYTLRHPLHRTAVLLDEDRVPEWTGLYNARAEKLFRPRPPFGFRR
jgi:hypothetical protein